jgi:hypothetical protein
MTLDGSSVFEGTITVLNEYEEIRATAYVHSTKHDETKAVFESMKKTLQQNLQPFPKHIYTDIIQEAHTNHIPLSSLTGEESKDF